MRTPCVFCQRSGHAKITREHAWPNWILKVLKRYGIDTIAGTLAPPRQREWTSRNQTGVKVRIACKPCNEGWMNGLEKSVKPILTPMIQRLDSEALTVSEQRVITTWGYKTAIVFEFAGNMANSPYFTPVERLALYRTRLAPNEGLFVSLAAYAGPLEMSAFHHRLSHTFFNVEDLSQRGAGTGHCTTISVGHLVLQVVAFKWPEDVRRPIVPVRAGAWDKSTVGIWPNPKADVTWPPRETLDEDGLVSFAHRWAPGLPTPRIIVNQDA